MLCVASGATSLTPRVTLGRLAVWRRYLGWWASVAAPLSCSGQGREGVGEEGYTEEMRTSRGRRYRYMIHVDGEKGLGGKDDDRVANRTIYFTPDKTAITASSRCKCNTAAEY